jgi:hypothetical protein
LGWLADLPFVLRAATHDEARAIVASVLSHVWIKDRELHAITPTLAFEPLLVGVWKTEVAMGCPTGINAPLFDTPTTAPSIWVVHRVAYQQAER